MEDWSYIWKKNLHTTIESNIINQIYEVFSLIFFHRTYKQKYNRNMYRPYEFNSSNPTIEEFMLKLNPIMDELSNENSYAMFTGDFNVYLCEQNHRWQVNFSWMPRYHRDLNFDVSMSKLISLNLLIQALCFSVCLMRPWKKKETKMLTFPFLNIFKLRFCSVIHNALSAWG